MAKFAKWIGGGLGWALGGPIGGFLGYALGSFIDKARKESDEGEEGESSYRHKTSSGDFGISLLVLAAYVMKADGKIMKSELDYVKDFFTKQFGVEKTKEFMRVLKELLDKEIEIKEIGSQIRYNMEHPMRLQLLHFLFGIAKADNHVHTSEVEAISQISHYLGIKQKDFESIKAMFYQNKESPYKILEISQSASDTEVKKAYRKMAIKYHPDKVATLGGEIQNAAKEKFQNVQKAYEQIKKDRGMS